MTKAQLLAEIDKILSNHYTTAVSKLAVINTLTASYLTQKSNTHTAVYAKEKENKPHFNWHPKDPPDDYLSHPKTACSLKDKLPEDYKDMVNDATFIRRVGKNTKDMQNCPVCDVSLFPYDKAGGGGKCWQCHVYFLANDSTVDALIKVREQYNKPTKDITGEYGPVYMWEQVIDINGEVKDLMEQLHPVTANKDLPW